MTVKGIGIRSVEFVKSDLLCRTLRLVPLNGGEVLLHLTPPELNALFLACKAELQL